MENLDHLFFAKREHFLGLLNKANVNGVAIGRKQVSGRETDEWSVIVTVSEKLPAGRLGTEDLVPTELTVHAKGETRSVAVDVVEVGTWQAGNPTSEAAGVTDRAARPVHPGASICGDNCAGSGTLGVLLGKDNKGYLLSNLHVMQADPFNPVLQRVLSPSWQDGGTSADGLGETSYYFPFKENGQSNYFDVSTSTIFNYADVAPEFKEIGQIKGHYDTIYQGWHLRKFGRTTGLTDGHIIWHDWGGDVDYGSAGAPRNVRFDHQVVIQNLPLGTAIAGGDSGAVWVTDDGYAAALNFAGNKDGGHSISTPIGAVLKNLKAGLWVRNSKGEMETAESVRTEDSVFSDDVMRLIMEDMVEVPVQSHGTVRAD